MAGVLVYYASSPRSVQQASRAPQMRADSLLSFQETKNFKPARVDIIPELTRRRRLLADVNTAVESALLSLLSHTMGHYIFMTTKLCITLDLFAVSTKY